MNACKRVDPAHVAAVLKRERELAPDLFRPHTDAELREIASALDRADQLRQARRLEAALPHPQVPLPFDARA